MIDWYSILFYQAPAILIALTIHEYSHGRAAYAFGDTTAKSQGRLTLNPIKHLEPLGTLLFFLVGFGWAKPVPVNPMYMEGDRRKALMWVSLAGPGSNFLLGIVAAVLAAIFAGHEFAGQFFQYLFHINIILAVFNLLPVPPLDGSKILAGLLPARYGYTIYNLERYGPIILLLLIIFGFTSYLVGLPVYFIKGVISSAVNTLFGLF